MIIKNEVLNALIKAFDYDTCQEATTIQNDSSVAYEVDLKKDGDVLNIVIERKKLANKDKEEFEAWLDTLDDDLFQEALTKARELTGESPQKLDDQYNSEQYKDIINLFKNVVSILVKEKIDALNKILA